MKVVVEAIGWPILQNLLKQSIESGHIYWTGLDKKGSRNYEEQTQILSQVLFQFKEYKIVVLGDREFCEVQLERWLSKQGVYFCLRLKKSTFVEAEENLLTELRSLGLAPGMSLFLNAVRVTKQKGFGAFNVACLIDGQ